LVIAGIAARATSGSHGLLLYNGKKKKKKQKQKNGQIIKNKKYK